MEISTIKNEESPAKRQPWKMKPRRSLGLPTESDWKRYFDGFDVPESLNTKMARKKKRLSNIIGKLDAQSEYDVDRSSQMNISGYSSEEDDFSDIKPLPGSNVKDHSPIGYDNKKRIKRKRHCLLQEKSNFESRNLKYHILNDSPIHRKATKTLRYDMEGIDIDITSPVKVNSSTQKKHMEEKSGEQEEEVPILNFGSQSQGNEVKEISPQISKLENSESPSISTKSSPEPLTSVNKQKTSDWLKHLHWTRESPQRLSDDEELSQEDSARKKKPKYKRGGLADRLQKILTRRKSDMTIWHHRINSTEPTPQDRKNSLVVQLLETSLEYSILFTKCRILSSNEGDERKRESDEALVLFSKSVTKKLSLGKGVTVTIFPPWQRLRSPTGQNIILCTQFCKCVPASASDAPIELPISSPTPSTLNEVARWKCPCVADSNVTPRTCPAHFYPSIPKVQEEGPSPESSMCSLPSDSQFESCLQTAVWSQASSQSKRGILENIERQGELHHSGITIEGTVQRVFYKNNTWSYSGAGLRSCKSLSSRTEEAFHKVSVLVQDEQNMCCEVVLPNLCHQLEGWKDLLENGEGKVWRFQGLRQQCRTNKQRSPGLFQVIEAVWPKEGHVVPYTSQEDSSQAEEYFHQANPQGFCYRLVASSVESSCRQTNDAPMMYRPPTGIRLCDETEDSTNSSRISFVCHVFYQQTEDGQNGLSGMVLYVIDGSHKSKYSGHSYTKISIRQHCHLSQPVRQELLSPKCSLIMKDVGLKNGHYYCDEFSRIYTFQDSEQNDPIIRQLRPSYVDPKSVRPTLPVLSNGTNILEGDLFALSGHIANVDENTACSWEVCDVCQDGDLTVLQSNCHLLHCSLCERPVTSPKTRFNLEVYIRVGRRGEEREVNAKVKLLQSTIESVLPAEDHEEGYEVQNILDKPLGPIPCVVLDISRNSHQLAREIHLQEISIEGGCQR